MPPPAVSIVMPLYKRLQFIDAAMEGILNQTFTDWECVLVDDGSEMPELAEMCRRYEKRDARIKYICQENGGLSAARNRGAAESSAEFISFQDDDDIMHPQRLEKEINFLRQNPRFAAVRSRHIIIDEKGKVTNQPGPDIASEETLITEVNSSTSLFLMNWNTIRADCFRAVGGFDADFRLAEDIDFTLRIIEKYSIALLPDELYFYRNHNAGKLSLRPLIGLYGAFPNLAAYYRRNNIPEPQGERPFNLLSALQDLPPEYASMVYKKMRGDIKRQMRERHYEQMEDMLRRFNAAFSFSKKYQRKMYWKMILWAVYYGKFAALPVIVKNRGAV